MTDKLQQAFSDLSDILNNLSEPKTLTQSADFIEFIAPEGKSNNNRGIVWTGDGTKKHLLLKEDNSISITESIDLFKNRSFMINSVPVLTEKELGSTVIKSNLREVGKLKGLSVDGNVVINGYLFYNGSIDRLGLGTDQPNSALSVSENGIEITIGTAEGIAGRIGTFANHDFEISTGNVSRILVEKTGDIRFGNKAYGSIKASLHGKLYIGSGNLDSRVDLQVDGPIKYQQHIHQYLSDVPNTGNYIQGDIIWNSTPEMGKCVGWVCVRSGTPGGWLPFGEIKHK
jgi:hypothetical protein